MHVKFGYRLAEDGKTLVQDELEQEVIRKIIACRDAGMSIDQIRAIMDSAFEAESEPTP
jgi:DNA-binding transcriptional MerR regulator